MVPRIVPPRKRQGISTPLLSKPTLEDLFNLAKKLARSTGDIRVSLFVVPGNPKNPDAIPYAVVTFTDRHGASHSVRYYGDA